MHGSRRVIVFCLLTTILPSILIILPLYLRNSRYADVLYKISDSDVIQIHKGQSSIFCERHTLKMNETFNAFQMKGKPVLSGKRKHIRLKKSMTLPYGTLEYWGFYLFKGATVELKACSRHEGSKILVVKGQKVLNTCGILEGNKKKNDSHINKHHGQVLVTLESPAETKIDKKVFNEFNDEILDDEEKELLETRNIIEQSIKKHSKLNTSNIVHEDNENFNSIEERKNLKLKRDINRPPLHNPNTVLDAGVHHGGNALNGSKKAHAAVSSFEKSLHECFHSNILINVLFPHSNQCNSSNYLMKTTTLKVTHEVALDGYYYYIFYSYNDLVQNDIHTIFDIYKPTFQYTNMSEPKVCVNQTECVFDVSFLSDELVIVEVPTRDGIRSEEVGTSVLISVCQPRATVYIFFPIAVLLLILLFAFL